jgi:hypothetical protein
MGFKRSVNVPTSAYSIRTDRKNMPITQRGTDCREQDEWLKCGKKLLEQKLLSALAHRTLRHLCLFFFRSDIKNQS